MSAGPTSEHPCAQGFVYAVREGFGPCALFATRKARSQRTWTGNRRVLVMAKACIGGDDQRGRNWV
jgi:hypothetical protein